MLSFFVFFSRQLHILLVTIGCDWMATVNNQYLTVHKACAATAQKAHLLSYVYRLVDLINVIACPCIFVFVWDESYKWGHRHLKSLQVSVLFEPYLVFSRVFFCIPWNLHVPWSYCIYSNPEMGVLKRCAPHHHVETSHGRVENRVSWPWFFTCRRWQYSGATCLHAQKGHRNRQHLHGWSNVNFLDVIPVWESSIDAPHVVDDPVTEKNVIQFSVHLAKHQMHFGSYLDRLRQIDGVDKDLLWSHSRQVNDIRVDLGFISYE